MNLQTLMRSRKKPQPGDLFTLQVPDVSYLFGRVISVEALAGWSMPGSILIYIYSFRSAEAVLPGVSELTRDKLLISPVMTNTLPWSKGYFQTLENRPLTASDLLGKHCFRSSAGRYYDEYCCELPARAEPCGDWGLHSFRTIDDEVSDALGVPQSRA
jgi:hypothetical protein